jgi:transglutaminase-like putative cysteine protease
VSSRHRLGFVAAAATLLAAAPLSAVFDRWTWLVQCLIVVALIAGAATLARSLRGPVWEQVVAMTAALLIALTWLFPSGEELLGFLPTPATIAHFGELVSKAGEDVRSYGVPVQDTPGLLFVTALGVGAVAVLVDLVTVGVRRPALAGLPMLAIYSVPVAVYTDSVPPVPFIIGAVGFLWLLVADNVDRVRRFGRRFTGDGRDVDVWEPSPLAAAGRRLAAVGVMLAVLAPLAVPGMTTGLFDRLGGAGDGSGPGNGQRRGPSSVNLFAELSGRLQQPATEDLIKVTTDDPSPYYLRFGVADDVTDRGFRSRSPSGRPVTRGLPDLRGESRDGVSAQQFHATVQITQNFDMPMLPVYAVPVQTARLDSTWFYDANMQIIFSGRSRSKGRTYEFDFVRLDYSPDALRRARTLTEDDPVRQQFASVPAVREVDERVATLTEGKRTQYDRVRALYDYFSEKNHFSYSLEARPGTSGSDIVDFLTNKKGFCEQYAAALAWLVRSAGIPARVAFGFTRGGGRSGDTYTLTNKNLHAWTEVYFDGFGWVPFDATPSSGVAGAVSSEWAPDPNRPVDINPSAPGAVPTGPDGADPRGGVDPRLERENNGLNGAGGGVAPNARNWPWWALSGALLVLALLAIPALLRGLTRRRRQAAVGVRPDAAVAGAMATETDPGEARVVATDETEAARVRADAHAAWDELIDTLVDFRVRVDQAETPRVTAERLVTEQSLPQGAADGVRLLGRAEERARYARMPLAVPGLGDGLRATRRALADQASRHTRWAAVLMPPSVLLRWRLAIMDGSGRTVTRLSGWRDSVVRFSPRRLLTGRAAR